MLEKTTRVNLLYDFYGPLLTDKQRMILEYYFREDFSLGEIADELNVSRQAVFEHVKRAESALNDWEAKLELLARHDRRLQSLRTLGELVERVSDEALRRQLANQLEALAEID